MPPGGQVKHLGQYGLGKRNRNARDHRIQTRHQQLQCKRLLIHIGEHRQIEMTWPSGSKAMSGVSTKKRGCPALQASRDRVNEGLVRLGLGLGYREGGNLGNLLAGKTVAIRTRSTRIKRDCPVMWKHSEFRQAFQRFLN